jgi:hypothetical protein
MLDLSIPLVGGRDQKRQTWSVEIDYDSRWQKEHWRTLESCYNRSPFFEYYAPTLKMILESRPTFLWQFCLLSLQWTLKQLRWHGDLSLSVSFEKTVLGGVLDLRNQFLPKNRQTFLLPEYQQQFGNRFEQNLSILDLIFNCGPQSVTYLNSIKPRLNYLP